MLVRYALVAASVVLAASVRVLLRPLLGTGTSVAFVTIFPAVIYGAWIAGLGGGLFATALSALLASLFILTPRPMSGGLDRASVISLTVFMAAGAAISLLGQAQQKARREAQQHAETAAQSVRLAQERAQVLEQSEAIKAAMLASALDSIITIDDRQRVLEWNPAAEQTFGYSREEAVGQELAPLIIPPPLRDAHVRGIAHFRQTGLGPILNHRVEVPAQRRDATEFPVELTVIPIAVGGRTLFTAFVRDLTEREKAASQQRAFLRDVLRSVTGGRLWLCHSDADLPSAATPRGPVVALSETEGIGRLRRLADQTARQEKFHEDRCSDLSTAVSEAAMNAYVHAGGGEGRICSNADTIQVWITDHGHGIDVARLPRATLEKGYSSVGTLGHGMKLMLATTDRVWLLTGAVGTTVVLEVDRVAPQMDDFA